MEWQGMEGRRVHQREEGRARYVGLAHPHILPGWFMGHSFVIISRYEGSLLNDCIIKALYCCKLLSRYHCISVCYKTHNKYTRKNVIRVNTV